MAGDITSFIGFLIYLEIILINCSIFTINVKDNMIKRCESEIIEINKDISTLNNHKEEEENNEIDII